MKAKIIEKYTLKDVQDYWKRINAPVYLRKCTTSDEYSVLLRPGCDSLGANAFVAASTEMKDTDRDILYRMIERKSPIADPVVVLHDIHGKML